MDNYYFGKPKPNVITYKNEDLHSPEDAGEYITERDDKYVYVDAKCHFFEIGGLLHPENNFGEYYRLYANQKEKYTDAHRWLSESTSGGSLRFYTNANEIVLKVKYRGCNLGMHHFCDRGVYGFDTYIGTGTDRRYIGKMMQTFADNPKENSQVLVLHGDPTELLIEFPLYGGIDSLSIGIPKEAFIAKPAPRKYKSVACYGSSITQGGCVSRPGTMYSNIYCRALDCDNINLGFSGSAFGELYAAEFLADRDISCFVMDYDYNSRSLEELQNTHKPFYDTVRKAHPDIPIIIVSHPCFWPTEGIDNTKRNVTYETYKYALDKGDNVYFVDGNEFFPMPMRDIFAVDNLHPNDLGHYYMAKGIWVALKKAFDIED